LNARARQLPVAAAALAVALAVATSACGDFADVTTVVDLRTLAAKTDPSEVFLKVNGLPATVPSTPAGLAALSAVTIDPASIPPLALTPLLPDPAAAGRAVTWSLVACPNNPYGAAPPGGGGMGAADPSGGAYTTVGSTLCPDGATTTWSLAQDVAAGATFDVTLTPDQLLAAFAKDIFVDQHGNVHGGFDLGLPINLQITATDGVTTAVAIKRELYWAETLPGQLPNQIPTITKVISYPDRDAQTWAPIGTTVMVDPTTPLHVSLGKGAWLAPDPVEAAADVELGYVTAVIDLDPPYEVKADTIPKEHIRYAYYATAGTFNPARTASDLMVGATVPPGATGGPHLESQYVPPATLDAVPVDAATGLHLVTVWIVVRDDRGGESWSQLRLALDPATP
jgi:hypothetical protein